MYALRLNWHLAGKFIIHAPHQGFFPKYTEGMHEKDGTVMIVSRGLGNSSFPFRIFNRPEFIEVTLRQEGK